MEHLRVIKVSMLRATDTKRIRVQIKENRSGITDKKILPLDYTFSSGKEQVIHYLQSIGINVVAEGYDDRYTYLMSDTWGPYYVNIKGEKPF